jgi:predicted PurR-regulated permease PerM
MDTKKLQLFFFIGLLVAVLLLAGTIVVPFLAPIALAVMLGVVARPVHSRILRTFGKHETVATLVTVALIFVVILIPVSLLVQRLSVESFVLYSQVSGQGIDQFDAAIGSALDPIREVFPSFNPDVRGAVEYVSTLFVNNFGAIFSVTADLFLKSFLFVISLFYVLRDGRKFKKILVELSPLVDAYDRQIIERLEHAINSIVRGSFSISIVQGTLVGTGFFVFGISNPVLWGTMASFSSFIPTVGTSVVLVPAILYLISTGSIGSAFGLAVWGFLMVGLIDNTLFPMIVGKGFTIHPMFIMVSIIGGISYFGIVGLFLGPLIVALLFALLDIYKIVVLDDGRKKITSM